MSRFLSLLALAGFGALLSTPAMAQEMPEHGVFIMNSLLFLFGGVLVMFMACGFCMLEAGLVRAKNTTMQLTKNVALFSIAAIGYYIIGYNLMYPLGSWSVDGILSGVIGTAAMEAVAVAPCGAIFSRIRELRSRPAAPQQDTQSGPLRVLASKNRAVLMIR